MFSFSKEENSANSVGKMIPINDLRPIFESPNLLSAIRQCPEGSAAIFADLGDHTTQFNYGPLGMAAETFLATFNLPHESFFHPTAGGEVYPI